ncbi:hypothetical protein BC332_09647 [Capsicum chinense]|nr:hypothetical protein BC332_09647 [Capsicum chinense]
MYGGSGKLGRGGGVGGRGGGGVGKRNIPSPFQPPPIRRSSPASAGRFPVGGVGAPRNRGVSSTSGAPDGGGAEETFSLVTGNPLNFAMIIKLAPDLVEEIRRVEAEGGAARIKFDANAKNSPGNVINVGSKNFKFTWSREPGDLCDIYEERRSGEDGNGLLVESGGAWRKLNVQRVLDESVKNQVRIRSEEAEKKRHQKQTIVLDHGNPSMKSQAKAMAAAEANPWRMGFKEKKEQPFKKRKPEPPPGVSYGASYKSGPSAATQSKGKPSASPLSSPPEPSGAPTSPFGNVNLLNVIPTQAMTKSTSSDKEIPSKATSFSSQDKVRRKSHTGAASTDLRSMLMSLLMENQSKGISLKAVEKAVGDTFPNSAKQIEPIMKKIAIYQAPGRYFLKPEVDTESFLKPAPESGSSPEDHGQPSSAPDKFDQLPAPQPVLPAKTDSSELEEGAVSDSRPQEASDANEKIDILHLSPDRSEGQAYSSSSSGSGSDSESSDSGSDSESQSRSRSKSVASGSSSDSESDASSNSKEASDEDVDIMSDDDKVTNQLRASEQLQCGTLDFEPGQFEVGEREDLDVVDIVEIEDLPDSGQVAEMAVIPHSGHMRDGEKPVQEIRPISSDSHEDKQIQAHRGKLPHEAENVSYQNHSSEIERVGKDSFNLELSHSVQKSQKSKSKRVRDEKRLVDKGDQNKRVKTQDAIQQHNSGGRNSTFLESSHLSPDKPSEGPYKGVHMQMEDRTSRDAAGDFDSQKSHNEAISRKFASDFLQPDRRYVDFTARGKTLTVSERPIKQGESTGNNAKHTERSLQMNEGFPSQRDKVSRESQDEYGVVSDKRERRISKDGVGDPQKTSVDPNLNKYDSSLPGNSPKDNMGNTGKSSLMNGRGRMLQRELSDLELGELREPPPQETAGLKKQVERKSSFKGENRPSSSDYWNFESSKGRTADTNVADFRRSSPLQSSSVPSGAPDGLSKRRTPERNAEDFSRPHQKVAQPQPQQPRPRINQNDVGSQYNQLVEVHGIRQIEEERSLGTGQEVHADNRRKSSAGAREQHDLRHGVLAPSVKQNKGQKSSLIAAINDKHKDSSLLGSYEGHQRIRESSPDEMSLYYKYEKEEAELKGPIENFAQYEEYVQEYREKYDNYCSINKILESYRNDFMKLGKELEVSGRDTQRFYDMLGQLKDSYRKCGPRHKRLKKIFIVLHEELKHLKQMIKEFAVSYARDP